MRSTMKISAALMALLSQAAAQTSTTCNPTNTTCPSDPGLSTSSFSSDFTQGQNTSWSVADYTTVTYSDKGAAFTINEATDAPTISTDFYIFFGYIEVKAQAAPGQGIVSSIVLLSDDLDEVDWEFLGGWPSSVQSNFFGKGNTTTYNREQNLTVSDTTTTYHTYALNWTSTSLTWLIDGAVMRTLNYDDPVALYGKNYPQTPCRLKLGAWAGGASSSPGTVAWAGGKTDFSQAPFTMYVDSVKITNYNPGSSYTYSDKTGDWQSIKIGDASTSTSTSTSNASSYVSTNNSSTVATTVVTSPSPSSSTIKNGGNTSNRGSSSNVTSSTTSSASSAVSSFVQGNNAMRRLSDEGILSSQIALVMAILGLVLL